MRDAKRYKILSDSLVSIETKLVILYSSALLGALISEIEICRISHWNCEPLRGVNLVQMGAGPMLAILTYTRMTSLLLGIASVSVGSLLLILGILSAHSDGSLTWGFHILMLLFGGSSLGIIFIYISYISGYDSLPVQFSQQGDLMSSKNKMFLLYTGAILGAGVGSLFIFGNTIRQDTFDEISISNVYLPWIIILTTFVLTTPIIILVAQLTMHFLQTIYSSIAVGILVVGFTLAFGESNIFYGYDWVGNYLLWFAGILAAYVAVLSQKRRIRHQTLLSQIPAS